MNDDMISRKAVLDRFQALCDTCGEGEKYNGVMCRCCYLDDGITIVEDIPAAGLPGNEPYKKGNRWHCGNCSTAVGRFWQYCQKCGEKINWSDNEH